MINASRFDRIQYTLHVDICKHGGVLSTAYCKVENSRGAYCTQHLIRSIIIIISRRMQTFMSHTYQHAHAADALVIGRLVIRCTYTHFPAVVAVRPVELGV